MTLRVASGIVGSILMISIMFLSIIWPFSLNLAIALVSCCSVCELIILKKEPKFEILSISSVLFSICRSLLGPGTIWQMSMYLYTLVCLIIAITRFIKNKKKSYGEQNSVWNVWFIFFLNIIISVSLGTIICTRNLDKNLGLFFAFISLGIAWSCDIGAYIFGKQFGKTKLCPYVSPKKTLEGAIGGIILCITYSLIISVICKWIFKLEINYMIILILSALGAPIAILGDLCFSLIKRLLNVKDFGIIIPGHGGILDRFDSVIFVSPFILLSLKILKKLNQTYCFF